MSNGMALSAGARIGPYEIVGLLGVGGMGEVYRARDTKLNREVAIKVLLAAVANDAERLARFSREAQLIASINHPNIAQIYGLEDAGDVRALVMELVEGPTLADRIARGAIPLEEALPIARQIAEALEAAHELGIIHRDLKPANIKIRADGTVKVLDFGLAKALDPAGASGGEAANSPTLSMQATAAGVILGTAAYMAPEQARGKAVDKRADIFAFGCVLFEMLTGRRAFQGEDITDTIVAVVSKEPDWNALPASGSDVRRLLVRCLKKDRRQRLQSIGDARVRIEELISGTSEEAPATSAIAATPSRRPTGTIAALVVVASTAALATWAMTKPAPPAQLQVSRFEIVPPPAQSLLPGFDRDIAISPDGRHIVYRSGGGGGAATGGQLVVRAIDRVGVEALPSVTNGRQPFFSPDSKWIGFFDGDILKKVSIAGGASISICKTTAQSRGASWGDDNRIVFATTDTNSGLLQVSAGGGEPKELTRPGQAEGETNHWYPSMLPGGRGVLFTLTARNAAATAQVAVLDSRTGQHKTLTRGSQAEYVQTGHLLYVASGTLHAVRFDLERLELLGDPMPLVDGVWMAGGGAAGYAVSRLGTLVYVPATPGNQTVRSLVWVDRTGKETAISAPSRAYVAPRLSPDGTRAALTIGGAQDSDIFILDLAREGPLRQLTFAPGDDDSPVWTLDGQRVLFKSGRTGQGNLFTQAADGTGSGERLTTSLYSQTPNMMAPDGSGLVGSEFSVKTASDIMWFPLKSSTNRPTSGQASDPSPSQAEPLIRTTFIEINPEISPDGRYIAYQADDSGRYEIYIRPFPQVDAGRWQVSSGGATRPAWARGGRELFYLDLANKLIAVPVQTSGATFVFGNPTKVFDTAYAEGQSNSRPYDVSVDGQRFLMIKENLAADRVAGPGGFVVVLNWFEELKAKVSSR